MSSKSTEGVEAKVARLTAIWAQVHDLQAEGLAIMQDLGLVGKDAPKEQAPKSEKPARKQRSTARKPKATQSAPDGFEVGGRFVYSKADGSKSIWTITSIEDAAVMAHRQGTTKARPWKFTSLAAMLQTGNVSLDLSEIVSKPKGSRKRKAA